MPRKPKQPRNWHAVNAFQRHAGPMKSRKREEQAERKDIEGELRELNRIMDLDMDSETYAAAADQREKLKAELARTEKHEDERERDS